MWRNPQETVDLVTFTEDIFCAVYIVRNYSWELWIPSTKFQVILYLECQWSFVYSPLHLLLLSQLPYSEEYRLNEDLIWKPLQIKIYSDLASDDIK